MATLCICSHLASYALHSGTLTHTQWGFLVVMLMVMLTFFELSSNAYLVLSVTLFTLLLFLILYPTHDPFYWHLFQQYTFILTASKELPKQCVGYGTATVKYASRKNVGVRISDDAVCQAILQEMGAPLICTRFVSSLSPRMLCVYIYL